jgi:hypothetical protein
VSTVGKSGELLECQQNPVVRQMLQICLTCISGVFCDKCTETQTGPRVVGVRKSAPSEIDLRPLDVELNPIREKNVYLHLRTFTTQNT